jgi:hypothetical protein
MLHLAPTVNTLHPHAHAKVAAGTNRTPDYDKYEISGQFGHDTLLL